MHISSNHQRSAALPSATRWALASLALSMLLSSLGGSIANVALPTMVHAFDASFQQVQWVILSYLLAVTTVIVSVGKLGDLIGRRRLLMAGIALFTLASLLCALAPTLSLLIAARAAQGLGAAVMLALTTAFVAGTVPPARTGSAMGLLATMSSVGTALGPTLGGMLLAGSGWPSIFLANVPVGLLALALAWRFLPADAQRDRNARARFDVPGTVLLALTLAAYALAMTLGGKGVGVLNLGLLGLAAASLVLFVRTQARSPSPLMRLAMFRNPVLSAGFVGSALVMTVLMATMVVGPFYLSGTLGLDTVRLGLVMSVSPLAAALAGVPAGRLVDRFGAHRVANLGLMVMLAGSLLLSMMPVQAGLPGYVVPLSALAAGYALFQTANNTAVMKDVQADQRGLVSGMLGLSRNLGLVTGASVMGAVFAFGSRSIEASAPRSASSAAGMHTSFAVAAMLIAVALAVLALGRARSLQAQALQG